MMKTTFLSLGLLLRLALGLLALASPGCSLSLDLIGSSYLNMRPSSTGQSGAQTTELMSVAILQLRSVPPDKRRALLEQVRTEWQQLREQSITGAQAGSFPESIKPLLAYDAKLLPVDRPQETFVVYPRSGRRYSIPLHHSTSLLLVIPLGHRLGAGSLQLLKASSLDTMSLCFHEYDVYPAEADKPWPCSSGDSRAGGYR